MGKTITIRLRGDDDSLTRMWAHSSSGAKKFGREIDAVSTHVRRSLLRTTAGFVGTVGIVDLLKKSSEAESNLVEQTTRAGRVFDQAAPSVVRFSRDALGLAKDQALEAADAIGAILRPVGILPGEAGRLSVKLVRLGVDLSSFANTPVPDALAAIQSGIVGQSRPLRRYGVLLSEARVQQVALAETGKRHAKDLTNEEKVRARIAIILKDTKLAQGDYARTLGGLANQERESQKNLRNLNIFLGQALNPTILEITKSTNKWLSDSKNIAELRRDARGAADGIVTTARAVNGIVKATGGWKTATELVIGLKVASTIAGWVNSLAQLRAGLLGVAAADTAVAGAATAAAGAQGAAATAGLGAAGVGGANLARRVFAKSSSGLLVPAAEGGAAAAVGASALASLTKVGKLRAALVGLSRLRVGPVLIPIVLVEGESHKQSFFDKAVKAFKFDPTRKIPGLSKRLGGVVHFLTGAKVTPDVEVTKPHFFVPPGARGPLRFDKTTFDALFPSPPKASRADIIKRQREWFDTMIGRRLFRLQDLSPSGQVDALDAVAALIRAQIAKTKDVTRLADLRDKLIEVARQRKAERQQVAADFLDALQLGLERAQATRGFGDDLDAIAKIQAALRAQIREFGATTDLQRQLLDVQQQTADVRKQQLADLREFLDLRLEKAQATAGFGDDIDALKDVQALIRRQIREEGKTAELERQLFENQQQILDARRNARDARQFRELGLDSQGNERVPGVKRLKAQLAAVRDAIKGTFLDTGKTRRELQAIGKALADALTHGMSREVRQKIEEMLQALDQQLKQHDGDRQTRFRRQSIDAVLRSAGLSPDEIRRVREALARRGPGGKTPGSGSGAFGKSVSAKQDLSRSGGGTGRGDVVVEHETKLDGRVIERSTTRHQQKRRRRNPPQKRGAFAGA